MKSPTINNPSRAVCEFVYKVCKHVEETAYKYRENEDTNIRQVERPVPFFGNICTARIITVGVNPSPDEFKGERSAYWSELDQNTLPAHLLGYFNAALPQHPWFKKWEAALSILGFSYLNGTAAHLDLSPRATIPMQQVPNKSLFHEMAVDDLMLFFQCLGLCDRAGILLIAGTVTNRFYINEFLKLYAPPHGYTLAGSFARRNHPGCGKTFFHRLAGQSINLPLFFCSSSPSNSKNPGLLITRVKENKEAIQSRLRGQRGAD